MGRKMNFFLSVLLVLVFGMGLSTCSYASNDYTDFEIPIEFWDSLIEYINNNVSLSPNGSTLSVNSDDLKNVYDNNIKDNLKNQIQNLGGDERNLIVVISNILNDSTSGNRKLSLYFLASNNTIGSINNSSSFYIYNSSIAGLTYSFYSTISCYMIEINYQNTISSRYGQPGSSYLYWRYNNNQIDSSTTTINNGPFFGLNEKPLNIINLQPRNSSVFNNYFINGFYNINPPPVIPEEPSGEEGQEGTTGTITNNSGDKTGKVDLIGIESGIGNINQNIDKTNEKLDGISGEIGNLNNSVNNLTNFLSGEISEEKTEEIERCFKY